jgi:hypothetical protein
VSRWRIQIPYCDRSSPLSVTAGLAHQHLTGDDLAVARQIEFMMLERGVRGTGELLDLLGAMEPSERRALLDRARAEAGLEPTADVDAREARRAPLAIGPPPATPTTELRRREDGTWYEESLNPTRWTYGPSGQLVEIGEAEAEAARQRALEESLQAQRRARAEDRAVDADAWAEYRRAEAQRVRRETPEGIPT